jgi:hypothetical protein
MIRAAAARPWRLQQPRRACGEGQRPVSVLSSFKFFVSVVPVDRFDAKSYNNFHLQKFWPWLFSS